MGYLLNPRVSFPQVVPSLGEKVFFKIRRSTKFSKVQKIYASKVGKDVSSIRFLYNGAQINDNETPSSLEMEDNDTIDVMVERAYIDSLLFFFPDIQFLTYAEVGEAASHRPLSHTMS
ncbi:ubiquitin-2 like Rad60 SUMO-like-domain-containing protein [Mycena polygramma]|nr:ubiquitin-2 like Rad60 SUMO-like-domain-containing protein [Mycena polygramma]